MERRLPTGDMTTESIAGFRLSPQQEHIVVAGNEEGYPVSAALYRTGPLKLGALCKAVEAVVERHEILRTVFRKPRELKIPLQVILDGSAPDVRFEDLSGLSAEEQTIFLQIRFNDAADRKSPAIDTPVLAATLFHLGHGENALLVAISSLCADSASFLVLAEELSLQLVGKTPDGDLIQYADVTEWQHDLLGSSEEGADAARAFWRNLAHSPLLLPLECESQGQKNLTVSFLSEDAAQLRAAALSSNVSEEEFLLAVWHLLLHRMTRESRTVVLAVSSGREYEEIANAIGLFVRHLPIAVDLDEKASFGKLLGSVSIASKQARERQDWFKPGTSTSTPGIGFDFLDLRLERQDEATNLSPVAVRANSERLKLRLIASTTDESLKLDLEYDPARYTRNAIEELGATYAALFAQAISNPLLALDRFSLLTNDGKRCLLQWGAGPSTPSPTSTIHALIAAQAQQSPDAIAVRSGAETLTYAELESRSNQLARYLAECGVRPGSLVGLCVSRSAAMMVPVLAILKAGGAYVPLSADQPKVRTAQQLAGIDVLITEQELIAALPDFAGRTLTLDAAERPWNQASDAEIDVAVAASDLAYVIYTSGSTGTPKGVGVRHSNLVNYATHIVRALSLDTEPLQFATVSTLSADLGNTVIYPALVTGGCLHVLPFDVATDGRRMAAYQAEYSIDVLKIVPSHLGALLDASTGVLPKRYLITGGEALKPALVARIKDESSCEVINHYGPTETTVGSLMLRLKDFDASGTATVPIGRPIANTRVYVLDQNLELLPVGVPGELYIAGAGVTAGYVGLPDKTAERFMEDPFENGELMYRTGDLVRWLPQGVIEFLGRADDQVKIRGYRVELGEIEAVLAAEPGVRQCVVIARDRQNNADDKQVVAYVVVDRQQGATAESVKQALKDKLPDYMVPSAIVEMSKLPLTSNGKVDRKALPAPEERTARQYKAPSTTTEELVAQIWSEVLKIDKISTDENFFDLGGHSLLATQVVSRVRRVLDVDLPLRTIFDTPTVSRIAERIDAAKLPGGADAVLPIVGIERNGPLPLSFAQQRLWILDQMEPNNPMYNIPRSLRLRGKLDESALGKALNEIVRRHEPLRSWFGTEAGQPVQHIEPSLSLTVSEIDLTATPVAEREAKAKAVVAEEGYKPFDLSIAPLLRVILLKLDMEDHVLILVMHHIVSDAWSADVFMRELNALYEASLNGRPAELPEMTVQYADYANWQRNWLQGKTMDEQLGFWRNQLAEAPPLLTLPTDRQRPEKQTFAGASMQSVLPADLCTSLKAVCKAEGVTLFMALLAGYQTMLSRLASQEQVVVGTDSANRFSVDTERMIGFFINLMPLKLDLTGDPSFREVLKRVRATTLACYGHQEMPFDKIVGELRPERSLSHNPIVQVLFVMQNAPSGAKTLGAIEVSNFSMPVTRSKFDVAVFAVERAETIDCFWVYSTELFDASTVTNMAETFETLLRDALANPETTVSALNLFSDEQKKRMKEERSARQQSSKKKLLNVQVKAIGVETGSKE